jgi:hypothetical protein
MSKNKKKKSEVVVVMKKKSTMKAKKPKKSKNPNIIKGKGGYISDLVADGGAWLGKKAGGWLGDRVEDIFGVGNYTAHNSIVNPSVSSQAKFSGKTHVVKREFYGDVLSSVDFGVQYVIPVNPGVITPWCGNIARNYQQWRGNGLVIQYVSESGVAISGDNVSLGWVGCAPVFNAGEPVPTTESSFLNYDGVVSGLPSQNLVMGFEMAKNKNVLEAQYVRTGDIPADDDIQFYDKGFIVIAVGGCKEDGDIIGKLYVTYDFALERPLVTAEAFGSSFTASRSGFTNSDPLGSSTHYGPFGDLAIELSGTTLNFPPNLGSAEFIVQLCWYGASTASLDVPGGTFHQCDFIEGTWFSALNSAPMVIPPSGSTSTCISMTIPVKVTGPGAYIVFDNSGTLPASGSDLIINVSSGVISPPEALLEAKHASRMAVQRRSELISNKKKKQEQEEEKQDETLSIIHHAPPSVSSGFGRLMGRR